MRHENACLLRWPEPGLNTATAHQNPDKFSGNRRDSDTHTTGPTLTIVAPAIEGLAGSQAQALTLASHSYTHTLLGVVDEMSNALEACL